MLSTFATFVLAANLFAPQTTAVLTFDDTGARKLEQGVLSEPLKGELVPAVRSWALSQRERYGLPATSDLQSTEAFGTRFGASFHLQQVVRGLEVYQAKLVVTVDEARVVTQVASSLEPYAQVREGENLTVDEALKRASAALPLVALRPDGVPYGGARAFYFRVGDELHRGWVANVHTLDFSKNWYVGIDGVTGQRLFLQNRVHHGALDAQVYPVSPGGLDAGVGRTPTVARELRHADGGSMLSDTCVVPQADGGFPLLPNDAGQLCGTQLMSYNCCPTKDCIPDGGQLRIAGAAQVQGLNVTYDVPVCDRRRLASNVGNGTADFVYTPVDPPTNQTTVVGTDLANSDAFAEVHSFYHVNTVYDWVRRLSTKAQPIFGGTPAIMPFKMRDERRTPAVRPVVWTNVMFPNFQELFANPGCLFQGPCRANTLLRLDNAAFFPRENFSQLPLPGFDTGADTLMIFQGNAADAAYDATVLQHEFGHGVVYATAALTFDDTAIDARSANNEGGAMHEAFADYIAAAFNNLAEVGPYFGPRVTQGQPTLPGVATDSYLRSMDNTQTCPAVLWGEVHQDALHVAGALWTMRKNIFQGSDQGDTFDAAFYAMLVSVTPNADFAMMAAAMAQRAATAFPSISNAAAQVTATFTAKGVIGCSKVLDANATNLPRVYYGIASAPPALSTSTMPGPLQLRIPGAAGVATITVTGQAQAQGGGFGGQPPQIRVLGRPGSPITFVRQGGALQTDAMFNVAATVSAQGAVTGTLTVNAACGTDVYVTLAAPGGGETLQNVNVQVQPLVNCVIPAPADAGTGGGGGTGGGAGGGGGGSAGGGTGGSTGTQVFQSVGPGSVTQQPTAKVGCGCSTPGDFAAPLLALLALSATRRRRG
jgi:MYXO-CTERM domain-containing protein